MIKIESIKLDRVIYTNDDFFRVKNVTDSIVEFEFNIKLDLEQCAKNDVTTLQATLFSGLQQEFKDKSVVNQTKRILFDFVDSSQFNSTQKNLIESELDIDATVGIDTNLFRKSKSSQFKKIDRLTVTPVSDMISEYGNYPNMNYVTSDDRILTNFRNALSDIDDLYTEFKFENTPKLKGWSVKQFMYGIIDRNFFYTKNSTSNLNVNLDIVENSFLAQNQLTDSVYQLQNSVNVYEIESDFDRYNYIDFRLKAKRDNINQKLLKLQVISKSGNSIETVYKTIELTKFIDSKLEPIKSPSIRVDCSPSYRTCKAVVKQNDKNAKFVDLYARHLTRTNLLTSFKKITSFEQTYQDGEVTWNFELPYGDSYEFRAISHDGTQTVDEFGFDVYKLVSDRQSDCRIVGKTELEKIRLEVFNIPNQVESILLLRKNITLDDVDYTMITENQLNVTSVKRTTYLDSTVKPNCIYEYLAKMYYFDGTIKNSLPYTIMTNDELNAIVDTNILNIQIDDKQDGTLNVKFDIESSIIENKSDIARSALSFAGYNSLFVDAVINDRDKLRQIIAYQIIRLNVTTGDEENFGTISTNSFDDSSYSTIFGISKILKNNQYRYEIRTLFRNVESTFESLIKKSVDEQTKKEFEFKPSKFRHPLSLLKGEISLPSTLVSSTAKDPMSFGDSGIVTYVDITPTFKDIRILNSKLDYIGNNVLSIKWNISDYDNSIDYILIVANEMNVKRVVSKSHVYSDTRSYEARLDIKDWAGIASYDIIIVSNNGEIIDRSTTNAIRIGV